VAGLRGAREKLEADNGKRKGKVEMWRKFRM
jgi:hypothetical protein